MIYFAWALSSMLILLLIAQLFPTGGVVRSLWRFRRELLPDDECPKAAVVLVLRGNDPYLSDCIERLIDFDYPDYDVMIVVDHPQDPAWQVVHDVIERRGAANVTLQVLREPLTTCTLNCSSLVQAVSALDESHKVIAFCDADTNPHATWLRELITPLVRDAVDIVTGQRWFMPAISSLGTIVRYVWNAGTVIAAAKNSVWGGSFALTRECLEKSKLIDCWRTCMGSDAMIYPQIRKHGFRLGFAASVMMINRETCDVIGFYRWVQRQLFVGKLYLAMFAIVFIHGMLSTLVLVAAGASTIVFLLTKNQMPASILLIGLLVYFVVNLVVLATMEFLVRRITKSRGEPINWVSLGTLAKALVAVPLTQFVFAAALVKAVFMREFEWRGVSYVVDGPWNVRLVEYKPFRAKDQPADNLKSL